MLKIWNCGISLCKCSPKICIFSSRIFLAKFQNLELKLYTQWETITCLLKNDKLGSNLLFLKQSLANSIILPPKNGGLKAWLHGVRKANSIHIRFDRNSLNSTFVSNVEFSMHRIQFTFRFDRNHSAACRTKTQWFTAFSACLFGAIWRQIQMREAMTYC